MTSRSEFDSDNKDAQQTLLQRAVAGDEDAITNIVNQSMDRLRRSISNRLPAGLRRHTDEDDVAQSVMKSFIRGLRQEGHFKRLNDTNDLWQILGMLTNKKLITHLRRHHAQKRGAGKVRGDSMFQRPDEDSVAPGFESVPDQNIPVVDEFVQIEDLDQLLALLESDVLKNIALLKLEGYEHVEIADRLDISVRSVGRKMQIIRDAWQTRLDDMTNTS